jgi:hypothetical protein
MPPQVSREISLDFRYTRQPHALVVVIVVQRGDALAQGLQMIQYCDMDRIFGLTHHHGACLLEQVRGLVYI